MSQKNTIELESILSKVIPSQNGKDLPEELVNEIRDALGEKSEAEFLKIVDAHGSDWGYQPRYETSTKIITSIVKAVMGIHEIQGTDRVDEIDQLTRDGYSVTLVSNHLSYGDINYLQSQLRLQGYKDLPLLVMAGPKVYKDTFRKLSSMSFETLKMAQPPSRASDGADVSMRELAEITRVIIKEAESWMSKGRVLHFFPEGSRSRSGELQRFIAASARYCSFENTVVFPVGFAGTEGLLSLNDGKIHAEDIHASIGAPLFFKDIESHLPKSPAEKRKTWMDLLGFAVADHVPEPLQGIYNLTEQKDEDLELARQVYLTIRKD